MARPSGMKQTVSGSVRPTAAACDRAYSRAAASSAVDSSGAVRVRAASVAGLGNGLQPSADSTARRMARRLLPPIHRGAGALARPGEHRVARGPEAGAGEGHALPGPGRLQGVERLVQHVVPPGEVGTQGLELRLQVAGAEPHEGPPPDSTSRVAIPLAARNGLR